MYPTKVSVWCTEPKRISQPNDILISVRAPVGDVNISDKSYSIGRGLSIMRIINSTINHFFLFYYFDCVKRDWNEKGSFFGAINRDVIENKLFALPPIEEQNEIVRKVELLMNKCNQLNQEIEQLKKHEKDLLKAMFNETFETKMEVAE